MGGDETESVQPGTAAAVQRVSYLEFSIGRERFGVPLEHLREVTPLTRLRRVPGAPAGVAGLVNLRGEIVCALDVGAILRIPMDRRPERSMLIALRGLADRIRNFASFAQTVTHMASTISGYHESAKAKAPPSLHDL